MKRVWMAINAVLLIGILAAGGFLLASFQGWSAKESIRTSGARQDVPKSTQTGPIKAIEIRTKTSVPIEGDAILVPPPNPLRLTIRPYITLQKIGSESVASYVDGHPRLEEEIEIRWKAIPGGSLHQIETGRYEFAPPEEGGSVELRLLAALRWTQAGNPVVLTGEKTLRLVCPVPWELAPQKVREAIGPYAAVKKGSVLYPYRNYYEPPSHLYQVTEENENWTVSPSFKLGDFDLHFDYTGKDAPARHQLPQYIALDHRLLIKLEMILQGLRDQGWQAATLSILAGYRSPAYNHWKKTQETEGGQYTSGFSRHLYGCAADFFVDLDGDGVMDDLNGDGEVDMKDAEWIRDNVVDAIDCQASEENPSLKGACGIYPSHDIPEGPAQTPNLHVDVRGWNGGPDLVRWDIDPQDRRRTLWSYWEKRPCDAEIKTASSN